MDELNLRTVKVLLEEYKVLKSEQKGRIGFRDNLLYVTVAAVGAVASVATSRDGPLSVLLVVPWVTFILGWTYLVNDQKISSIGEYTRLNLDKRIRCLIGSSSNQLFGWEVMHRSDELRVERKWTQFIVDLLTFVGSGTGCIVLYLLREPNISRIAYLLCGLEALLMIQLGVQIVTYLEWKREQPGQ